MRAAIWSTSEGCGALAKKWQIDHIRADGLLGEPTIDNAQLLGECCYAPKNANDTETIARAKRREAKHLGVKKSAKLHSGNSLQRGKREPKRIDPSKRCAGPSSLARRMGITEDA